MVGIEKQKSISPRKLTAKEQRRIARERFLRVRRAEEQYRRSLVKLANEIAKITKKYAPKGVVTNMGAMTRSLVSYSKQIQPFAKSAATKMIAEVDQRDKHAWTILARSMGIEIGHEITAAQMTNSFHLRLDEQIKLITKMPLEAVLRIQHLSTEALRDSTRANDIAKEIMRQGDVSKNRAKLIARTEVATTQSLFTETRAKAIGSKGYIWRTAMDEDVRPATTLPAKVRAKFVGSHRKLEGQFIPWNKPPVSGSNGERAHAGQIYNCRCWPEPVIPDQIG